MLIVAARAANGDMTLNLRFENDLTEIVLTPADQGRDIVFSLWAAVTNIGGVNGTGTHEGLNFLSYSVLSQRLLAGPGGAVEGAIVARAIAAQFAGPGSHQGQLRDLNADGLGDLGDLSSGPTTDVVNPNAIATRYDDGLPAAGIPIPNGFEFLVQQITFRVEFVPAEPVTGAGTRLNIVIPTWIQGAIKGANWRQDSNKTVSDGLNDGIYFAGTSVTFLAVPEPGSAALLAAASIAILLLFHYRFTNRTDASQRDRPSVGARH